MPFAQSARPPLEQAGLEESSSDQSKPAWVVPEGLAEAKDFPVAELVPESAISKISELLLDQDFELLDEHWMMAR